MLDPLGMDASLGRRGQCGRCAGPGDQHRIGLGRDDLFKCAFLAKEIRREDFDGRFRAARADGADGQGEQLGSAIFAVVAVILTSSRSTAKSSSSSR